LKGKGEEKDEGAGAPSSSPAYVRTLLPGFPLWKRGTKRDFIIKPLSDSFPLSNMIENGAQETNLFERGSKGVSERTTGCE